MAGLVIESLAQSLIALINFNAKKTWNELLESVDSTYNVDNSDTTTKSELADSLIKSELDESISLNALSKSYSPRYNDQSFNRLIILYKFSHRLVIECANN